MTYENIFVPKIDKDQWDAYLDVQTGGETNMWDTNMVAYLSGGELDKDEVLYCIKYYNQLSEHFGYNAHGVK
jgi:hypothetical protein